MDEVIIDFDRDENSRAFITAGSFYVAITRVTNGSKLWLRNFSVAYIQTDPQILANINTMRDKYPYTMKKSSSSSLLASHIEYIAIRLRSYLSVSNVVINTV
jgi:hypothetical protein